MIKREHYLSRIRPFYDSDLIKVITGIRRCGKSVIMQQIRDELIEAGKNVIYLEFENRRVRESLPNADAVLAYVDSQRGPDRVYVFLDELQELENWPAVCQTLRLENASVFVTGSNAKLLSGEFTEMLSGRAITFRIRPFVFRELAAYAQELGKDITPADYLIWGGFPKRLEFDGEAMRRYLEDLNETIIYKDIILHYEIRKPELFRAVTDFILRSNSRIVSANAIYKAVRQQQNCSINTITKYIGYLTSAYAVDTIRQYSEKTKQALSFFDKLYDADVSLNSIRCPDNRYDLDHNLENIIYNELLYMGYHLSVFRNGQHEIDFLAQRDGKQYLIQVAYSVVDPKAYDREFGAFRGLDNSREKILITTDPTDYSTSTVRHIRLDAFLNMESL